MKRKEPGLLKGEKECIGFNNLVKEFTDVKPFSYCT